MSGIAAVPIRTLLVSDVHLGGKHARSEEFLAFLQRYRPDHLYLVGDFFDAWKVKTGWHWPESCDRIVAHLNQLVEQGTQLHYTPGNHDAFLRQESRRGLLPGGFPQASIADEFVYETLHGWKFLVTHGDLFDFVENRAQWLSQIGSFLYDTCLSLNRWLQSRFLGEHRNPYGACAVVKGSVKRGVKFISGYEEKIISHARSQNCHGVICGHIHSPGIKQSGDIVYCNTGDWVENCTGLIEHRDGGLELVCRYDSSQSIRLTERCEDPIDRLPEIKPGPCLVPATPASSG